MKTIKRILSVISVATVCAVPISSKYIHHNTTEIISIKYINCKLLIKIERY